MRRGNYNSRSNVSSPVYMRASLAAARIGRNLCLRGRISCCARDIVFGMAGEIRGESSRLILDGRSTPYLLVLMVLSLRAVVLRKYLGGR